MSAINIQAVGAAIKKYPVLVVCIILSFVFIVTLFLRSGMIEQLQLELDGVNKEVKRYSSNISNSAQLSEQTDFIVKANAAVKDRTLSADSLAINLQYFYRLETEIGVKYLDLRPGVRVAGKPGVKQTYVPLNYIVTIQGTFEQILTYIKHIERGAYFARINTASATGGGSTVTVNLNLDLLGSP